MQFARPEDGNAITGEMVRECRHALSQCGGNIAILVIEGSAEAFCVGRDFKEVAAGGAQAEVDPEDLYDLLQQLAAGPFITISHVRGRANAGGVGFVAACDMAIASETAQFGLSELLFGLYPACVLPFLIRKVGFQRAHYMTLTTRPVAAAQAVAWGLVDVCGEESDRLLRGHLLRVRNLSKVAITRYKRYVNALDTSIVDLKAGALAGNREIFSDPLIVQGISRYVSTGRFPWEEV